MSPTSAYNPHEGNYKVIECKNCGHQQKVLKKQMQVLKVRCRNCGGTRWRTIQ